MLPNKKKEQLLKLDYLKSILKYDNGNLIRIKKVSNNTRIGQVGGCIDKQTGYKNIVIRYNHYALHRLIWFYCKGQWPQNDIDHINGDKLDNRIENLRDVTSLENHNNRMYHRDGTKLVGAFKLLNSKKKFYSVIRYNGERIWLGTFYTEIEANTAYLNKRKELGI